MEEVTLEKMDSLRERTGVSYSEAKSMLEKHNGNLIEALIDLENVKKTSWTDEFSVRSGEVVEKVKEFIREGNVTLIRVKHENRTLVEIPVTFGAIGAVVLPQLAALGVLVAVLNAALSKLYAKMRLQKPLGLIKTRMTRKIKICQAIPKITSFA